jgi:hypothetical protein
MENNIGKILENNFNKIIFNSKYERRVIKEIINCRTEKMGQRVEKCDHCGNKIIYYNSCRNRNCPNCQGKQGFKWMNNRLNEALPTDYFHSVFTIPEELRELFLYNKRVCINILFKSVSRTLTQVAKRNLKIKTGFITILHTWNQKLLFHPHIHVIIPGGGISFDESKWISVKNGYLLPKKKLSLVFRGKILFYLNKAFRKGKLNVKENYFLSVCNIVSQKDWCVYVKRSIGGATQVLKYLSQYTHKVGISNRRIISYDDKTVTFSYLDRDDGNKKKTLTLPVMTFIKRFMLHIVPKRLVKIRFYGFMANICRKKKIELCRDLIMKDSKELDFVLPNIETGKFIDHTICPLCKAGKMKLYIPTLEEYLILREKTG